MSQDPGFGDRFVLSDPSGGRLDRAISRALIELGRSASVREVRIALEEGAILVDGRQASPGSMARPNLVIDLKRPLRSEYRAQPNPELSQVAVVAEWEDLVAFDKPSGMACHPIRTDEQDTLLSVAAGLDPALVSGPPLEGGLVHRLDTATSGVVMFAKHPDARARLRAWFSNHEVVKTYAAVTSKPAEDLPEAVQVPIRSGPTPERVVVGQGDGAQLALTEFASHPFGAHSLFVYAKTRYGRRHQVRAHLGFAGAPIVGDSLYGGRDGPRLMLHASRVELPDGRVIEAPLPAEFRDA